MHIFPFLFVLLFSAFPFFLFDKTRNECLSGTPKKKKKKNEIYEEKPPAADTLQKQCNNKISFGLDASELTAGREGGREGGEKSWYQTE